MTRDPGRTTRDSALRLLIVVRGGENYGTATKILGLVESLAARNAPVALYMLGEGEFLDQLRALPFALEIHVDRSVPPRFERHRFGRLAGYSRTVQASLPFMGNLVGFLRRHAFDAMVFCEHGLVLQVGLIARRAGTPAFWLMANDVRAGYPFDINRRLYAFAFRHLGVTPVANSEHTRATLGRGACLAGKINLGVNPERMRIDPASSAALMPPRVPGRVRLLVMSRLIEKKGHKVLLQAMLSRPEFADIELVVCGGPLGTPYTAALLEEAKVRGADDRLHLLGPVSDVAAYYREADVVANARLDPEPFGLSIVEAMLVGKPILAHACGGPADIVVDGVTGWHVTAPAVDAFADGLARMTADRERWLEMGAAAQDRARQHYTCDSMTDQLLAVIAERLRSRP